MLHNEILFHESECCGLCGFINQMYFECLITADERSKLSVYLQENVPVWDDAYQQHQTVRRGSIYFYHIGQWPPRENYIRELIKRIDNEKHQTTVTADAG